MAFTYDTTVLYLAMDCKLCSVISNISRSICTALSMKLMIELCLFLIVG